MRSAFFSKRLKNAVKCILGKEVSPAVVSHEYKLQFENRNSMSGMFVIVTGGTGAIGTAICYELAARGAIVGVCGRNEEKIKSMIDNTRKYSPTVASNLLQVVLDVNNDDQIENAIANFVKSQGKIDVLVNNAGGQPGKIGEYSSFLFNQSIEQIDMILDTNLRGTIMCSRVAAKYMSREQSGQIINIASVIGIGGKAGYCDYAATKAGIIGFTRSYALEMSQMGVRVNCISPGTVNQIPFDGGSKEYKSSLNALGRVGFTREIADTVVFLIQNKYVTGQNIIVDGGRSLGLYGDNQND